MPVSWQIGWSAVNYKKKESCRKTDVTGDDAEGSGKWKTLSVTEQVQCSWSERAKKSLLNVTMLRTWMPVTEAFSNTPWLFPVCRCESHSVREMSDGSRVKDLVLWQFSACYCFMWVLLLSLCSPSCIPLTTYQIWDTVWLLPLTHSCEILLSVRIT